MCLMTGTRGTFASRAWHGCRGCRVRRPATSGARLLSETPEAQRKRRSAPENAEQALKVGKKQDVEFTVETLVGEMRLKPGRYVLQHRVDGSDHFVHFTEVAKAVPASGTGGGATKAHPGEVKCGLEPLEKKVKQTTVYMAEEGEARRVTKVLIRGENVAHVF